MTETDPRFDIRMVGRIHPKADLTCQSCFGRGWLFVDYEGVKTVQKCDGCRVFFNDVEAARAAQDQGIDTHYSDFPCYVLDQPNQLIQKLKLNPHWYFRYHQNGLLLCEVFDEKNRPIALVGVTDAQKIVDGVNALHIFNENKEVRKKALKQHGKKTS